MNGRILLDTNAIISLFANDQSVLTAINASAECFLPVVVLGELLYGARKSQRVNENVQRIQELQRSLTLLDCDEQTAHSYSDVKNALRLAGRPIPENDIWIAAIALQHDLSILSQDAHFDSVQTVNRIDW